QAELYASRLQGDRGGGGTGVSNPGYNSDPGYNAEAVVCGSSHCNGFRFNGHTLSGYIVDSAEGSLNGSDDTLGLDRLNLRRNQNELNVRGRYRLPAEVGKFASQPAEVDVALNAPEAGDFWVADSPQRVSGPLQLASQIQWKQGIASGQ